MADTDTDTELRYLVLIDGTVPEGVYPVTTFDGAQCVARIQMGGAAPLRVGQKVIFYAGAASARIIEIIHFRYREPAPNSFRVLVNGSPVSNILHADMDTARGEVHKVLVSHYTTPRGNGPTETSNVAMIGIAKVIKLGFGHMFYSPYNQRTEVISIVPNDNRGEIDEPTDDDYGPHEVRDNCCDGEAPATNGVDMAKPERTEPTEPQIQCIEALISSTNLLQYIDSDSLAELLARAAPQDVAAILRNLLDPEEVQYDGISARRRAAAARVIVNDVLSHHVDKMSAECDDTKDRG